MRLKEILQWAESEGFRFEFRGDENTEINGFSSLNNYKPETITWMKNKVPENDELVRSIRCAVIQKGLNPDTGNVLISENSKELFFSILAAFFTVERDREASRIGTFIGKDVVLDEPARIGCNCVLDGRIRIGKGTVIEHNVVIMNDVTIGGDCIIHSGTVIGKDGFGFAFDKDQLPKKASHFGGVVIGDRVEIGANCTVDRGTIDSTVIGDDVKIDSLSLIAHNVRIGNGTMIIGCTSLGGSTTIGQKSYIGPHVFVKNQLSVGDNSLIGMGVIVNKSVEDDTIVASNDLKPIKAKNYRRLL